MKLSLPTFAFAALMAGAFPAFANIGPVELPRLTFPDDSTGTETGQGCSQPTTLSTDRCEKQDG